MQFARLFRHLLIPAWWALRAFPDPALRAIEEAIGNSEHRHQGELRFVVEAGLPVDALWRGESVRERAIDLFSRLRVWDSEENSGVLIYVELIDRRVEIVADRGINARLGEGYWKSICARLEVEFKRGHFVNGTLSALDDITVALGEHFPAASENRDELPNAPLVY